MQNPNLGVFIAKRPLQPRSTSMEMICHNDILFNVIYGSDIRLVRDLLNQSIERLHLLWDISSWQLLYCKIMFFLLLDIDLELKELLCRGMCGMSGLPKGKAQHFFLQLRSEVIDPFFRDSEMSLVACLDNIKNLYLVSG